MCLCPVCLAARCPLGCLEQDNQGIEELQLTGRDVPFCLYNQTWKKPTNYFSPKNPKWCFLNFLWLVMTFFECQNIVSKIGGILI